MMVTQGIRSSGRVRAVLVVVLMLVAAVLIGVGDEDAPGIPGYLDSAGTGLLMGCGTSLALLLWNRREQP